MNDTSKLQIAVLATLAFVALVAISSPTKATDNAARFTMQKTDEGMLRLDTLTGAVSLCQSRDNAWACARIEDDSAGLENELRELRAENRRLRKDLDRLQARLDTRPERSNALTTPHGLPSEEDVDRAFTFLEGILKRFKGMVEDLQEKPSNSTPL